MTRPRHNQYIPTWDEVEALNREREDKEREKVYEAMDKASQEYVIKAKVEHKLYIRRLDNFSGIQLIHELDQNKSILWLPRDIKIIIT